METCQGGSSKQLQCRCRGHVASYSRAYTQCGGGRLRPPAAQNTQTATGPAQGAAQLSAAAAPQSTASTAKCACPAAATGTGAALTLHTHYRSRRRGRGARGLREGYLVAEGGVLRHHGHGCPRKSAVLCRRLPECFQVVHWQARTCESHLPYFMVQPTQGLYRVDIFQLQGISVESPYE